MEKPVETSVELSDRVADKADAPQHDTIEHADDLPQNSESGGEQQTEQQTVVVSPSADPKTDMESGVPADERVTAKAWLCVFVSLSFCHGVMEDARDVRDVRDVKEETEVPFLEKYEADMASSFSR